VGVDRLGRALLDLTVDADHPFRAYLLDRLESRAVRVGDALGDAVVIAQVDEQQTAVVAHSVHPARQSGSLADIGLAQAPTGLRAVAVALAGDVGRGRSGAG